MAEKPKWEANLKPIKKGELTSEEAKARGSNGGKKSGQARRKKRDAKAAMRYLLGLPSTGKIDGNLEELGFPNDERTNMAALQARLFALAMAGNLEAYEKIIKIAGFDPEEIRKERESLAADARREKELKAKVEALGNGPEGSSAALNMNDEDGHNDVVIYMPQVEKYEDCEMPPEDDSSE